MNDPKEKMQDFKLTIAVILFLISFAGAVGSYFKTTYNIKYELQNSLREFDRNLHQELREIYATKEETRFQHEMLIDIKRELIGIKKKLDEK